jgi:hypothetical protein
MMRNEIWLFVPRCSYTDYSYLMASCNVLQDTSEANHGMAGKYRGFRSASGRARPKEEFWSSREMKYNDT